MSDTLKIRHFDRLSTGTVRAKAQFRLVLVKTGIRLSLTPALRLGLVSTRPAGALAQIAQQHEVVHVIYCQSLSPPLLKGDLVGLLDCGYALSWFNRPRLNRNI